MFCCFIVPYCFKLQTKNQNSILQLQLMGSSQSGNAQAPTFTQEEIKQLIEENLKNNRLKLDHQSNVYEKCQYLRDHYSEYQNQFDEFFLTHNMISIELMTLLSRINLMNLKTLSLSNNDISCQSLKPFKDMKLRNLRYLFLDHNLISNDGCYYLTRTNLQSLYTLDISNNNIETEGCKHLAKANLPNLRTLLISNNKFTQKGLLYLSQGEWQLLAFIQVKQCGFQPNKELEKVKFRSEVKVFRLQIQ